MEYIQTGLANADTGARWAKTRLEAFEWGAIENDAPSGGEPTYNWTCADAQVAEWQQAGVDRIQSYMSPKNAWGSRTFLTDIAPKASHEADYVRWVGDLVERYDGDGVDDMPGLVAPVRHWVVGGEWTGFWPKDDPDDYLHVLELTAEAMRAADPDVVIGAIPFLLIDIFEGNEPSDAEISERASTDSATDRNSMAGLHAILDRPDLWDYLDVHSLGDYTELPPLARWLREQMAERGYDKPIWIDDAFPISFLANNGYRPAWHPVTDDIYDGIYDELQSIAKGTDDGTALAWIQAECAKGTVHKAVTALGEGYAGIQLGNTEDWMTNDHPSLRSHTVSLIGAAAMMGMVDVTRDGLELDKLRTAGEPRPAWHAMTLAQTMLGDGDFDVRERVGGTTGVRGYYFERAGAPLWVLWAEDNVLQLPGHDEAPTSHTLDVGELSAVTLTTTPTSDGDGSGAVETIELPAGSAILTLSLTSVPVFVGPAE